MHIYGPKPLMKVHGGYTFLELIVAISIAAIIGAAGFAAYDNYAAQQTLINVAQDIKTSIQTARSSSLAGVKVSSVMDASTSCADTNTLTEYKFLLCPSTGCSLSSQGYEVQYVCGGVAKIYNKLSKALPTNYIYDTAPGMTTCLNIEFLTTSNIVNVWDTTGTQVSSCQVVVKSSSGKEMKFTIDSGGNVSEPTFL